MEGALSAKKYDDDNETEAQRARFRRIEELSQYIDRRIVDLVALSVEAVQVDSADHGDRIAALERARKTDRGWAEKRFRRAAQAVSRINVKLKVVSERLGIRWRKS